MKLCATIAAGLTIALTGTAMADSLTVATWGGTFTENQRKAVFDPFAKESGNEVLDAVYNGGLGQLRAMAETGDAKWDVIQMEAADLVLACEEGLIEPIDAARIEAAAALGDAISECGVGALGWSVVIGYIPRR